MLKEFIPIRFKKKYWKMRGILKDYWNAYKPIIETNSLIKNTIIIAGSARSGTTWVGSVCAKMLNARPIFEPFILSFDKQFVFTKGSLRIFNQNTKTDAMLNFSLYLNPIKNIDSPLVSQMEQLLKGKVRSSWTDKEVSLKKVYSKRVIKDVRINLLLYFISLKWPEIKIIWLHRNPLKVIQSQLYLSVMHQWEFDLDMEYIFIQKDLIDDWLYPFIDKLKKVDSKVDRLAHRWCIENYVPFKQKVFELPNVLLISYESLRESLNGWKKIGHFLGEKWQEDDLNMLIKKPSFTYRKKSLDELEEVLKKYSFDETKILDIVKGYGLGELIAQQ